VVPGRASRLDRLTPPERIRVVQPPLDVSVTLPCVLPARAALLMTAGIAAGSLSPEILEPVRRQGRIDRAVLVIEGSRPGQSNYYPTGMRGRRPRWWRSASCIRRPSPATRLSLNASVVAMRAISS